MDTRWGKLIAVLAVGLTVGCESVHEINPKAIQRSSQNEASGPTTSGPGPTPTGTTTPPPTPSATPVLPPTPPAPTPTLTPPPSSPPAGVSIFDFKGSSNGLPLPTTPTGNGYVRVDFPSHSIVSTPVDSTKTGAVAHCEYWLYDDQDRLVLHVQDTVGGFHPNFFNANPNYNTPAFTWLREWAQNFVPMGPFGNANERANNHLPLYTRYVVEGTYRWVFKNLGNTIQLLRAGLIRAGNGVDQVNENLNPGESVTRTLRIYPGTDPFDEFKMNTNNYTP